MCGSIADERLMCDSVTVFMIFYHIDITKCTVRVVYGRFILAGQLLTLLSATTNP